jgi:hypothetical protein
MMRPENDAEAPDPVDPPFTTSSAEGLLIGVPLGIVMVIIGGAMRVNIAVFNRVLSVCIGVGILSSLILTRRALVEKLSAGQRTALEMLILLGFASMVCAFLVRLFLAGRIAS